MELDEKGYPIIPEDLKNKPQSEWTPEDWERSGGSGRAVEGPEMLGAALSITPAGRAVSGAIGTVERGVNIGKKVWQSPQMKGVRTSDFVQNFRSGGDASKMQKTVKPIEQVGNAIDEIQAIPSMQLAKISRLNRNAGFKGKDLVDNFNLIQDILYESSINFEDKGGFLDVNNWTIPQGYMAPRQDTISKLGGRLWKQLQEIDKLRISEVVTELEDFHQRGLQGQNPGNWSSSKPTRGFKGNRIVTTSDGVELGIAWDGGNQSYRLFDVQKARNSALGRYQADKAADDPLSWLKGKSRKGAIKIKNRDALAALDRIKNDHPNLYFDILGSIDQPDTVWTVEHINSRSSGVWDKQPDGRLIHKFKKKSDGSPLYFGDAENLMPATGTNYGRLKTNMENSSLIKNSNYYIDIDPVTRNFFLANRNTGKPVTFRQDGKVVQINGMTPANRWESALNNVLNGGDEVGIVDSMMDNPGDPALRLETGDFGRTSSNTRLEPNNQVPAYEPTYDEQILDRIDKHPNQVRLRNIYEQIVDHESGVQKLDQKTYKRYKKEFTKAILQRSIFDK